jgi:hypothetical protein
VAGVARLMTMTVRISTTATGTGNGTRAHVTQLGDLHLNSGAAIFKVNQRVGHLQLHDLAYHYARLYAAKKENSRIVIFTARTHTRLCAAASPYLKDSCYAFRRDEGLRVPIPGSAALPAPLVVDNGDSIALELPVSADGKQKVVDCIKLLNKPAAHSGR